MQQPCLPYLILQPQRGLSSRKTQTPAGSHPWTARSQGCTQVPKCPSDEVTCCRQQPPQFAPCTMGQGPPPGCLQRQNESSQAGLSQGEGTQGVPAPLSPSPWSPKPPARDFSLRQSLHRWEISESVRFPKGSLAHSTNSMKPTQPPAHSSTSAPVLRESHTVNLSSLACPPCKGPLLIGWVQGYLGHGGRGYFGHRWVWGTKACKMAMSLPHPLQAS
jgi:hypothetical protein